MSGASAAVHPEVQQDTSVVRWIATGRVDSFSEVAERPAPGLAELLREGTLLAVRRAKVVSVPAAFFDTDREILRFLPSLVSVLRDGGYRDDEILRWMFTEDDTLPGRPVDALHGDLAREVIRRAQAMAF